MSWHTIAEAIGWLAVAPLSVYTTYGLVFVPLSQWFVLRSYQRRRRALRDYVAADDQRAAPRNLQARDLRDPAFVALVVITVAVFALPYLNWIAVMIPGALAPVFGGWWWLRLRAKHVSAAHVYAWLALVAHGVAWSCAMLLHIDTYAWQDPNFGDFAIPWFTSDDLIGGRIGIGIGVVAYVAVAAGAIATARMPGGRRVADLATAATVPLAVQMWLSVPAGPVYLAWAIVMLGFWVALRQAEIDPRGPEPTFRQLAKAMRQAATGGLSIAFAPTHRDLVAQFLTAAALSATVLLALRAAPPENIASPLAGWSALAGIGLATYLFARRTATPATALNLALGSQLTAIMAATMLAAGIWALSGDALTPSYSSSLTVYLIVAQAAVLLVGIAVAWILYALTADLRRFGALLLGWSWPFVLLFAINIHGFDPTPGELTDFYAPSQVVSVAIGMTLWLAAIWQIYGDEKSTDVAVAAAPTTTSPTTQSARPDRPIPHTSTVDIRSETRV